MATEKTLEIQKKQPKVITNFMDQLKKLQKLRAIRLNAGGLMVMPKEKVIKASTHNHSRKSSKSRRKMAAQSRKINRRK